MNQKNLLREKKQPKKEMNGKESKKGQIKKVN